MDNAGQPDDEMARGKDEHAEASDQIDIETKSETDDADAQNKSSGADAYAVSAATAIATATIIPTNGGAVAPPPINSVLPPTNMGPPPMNFGPPPLNIGFPPSNIRPPSLNIGPPPLHVSPPSVSMSSTSPPISIEKDITNDHIEHKGNNNTLLSEDYSDAITSGTIDDTDSKVIGVDGGEENIGDYASAPLSTSVLDVPSIKSNGDVRKATILDGIATETPAPLLLTSEQEPAKQDNSIKTVAPHARVKSEALEEPPKERTPPQTTTKSIHEQPTAVNIRNTTANTKPSRTDLITSRASTLRRLRQPVTITADQRDVALECTNKCRRNFNTLFAYYAAKQLSTTTSKPFDENQRVRDKLQLALFTELCANFGIVQFVNRTRLPLIFKSATGGAKQCTQDQLAVMLAVLACEILSQSQYSDQYIGTKTRVSALFRRMYLEDCNRAKLLSAIKDFEILNNRASRRRASILRVVPFVMAFRDEESNDEVAVGEDGKNTTPTSLRGASKKKKPVSTTSEPTESQAQFSSTFPSNKQFRRRLLSHTMQHNVDKCLEIVKQHDSTSHQHIHGSTTASNGVTLAASASSLLVELGIPEDDDSFGFRTRDVGSTGGADTNTKGNTSAASMAESVAAAWSREFSDLQWNVSATGGLVATTQQQKQSDQPQQQEQHVVATVPLIKTNSVKHFAENSGSNTTSTQNNSEIGKKVSSRSSKTILNSNKDKQDDDRPARNTRTKRPPVFARSVKTTTHKPGFTRSRTSKRSPANHEKKKEKRVVTGSPPPPRRLQNNILGSAFVSSTTRTTAIEGRPTRRTRLAEQAERKAKTPRRSKTSLNRDSSKSTYKTPRPKLPSQPTNKRISSRDSPRIRYVTPETSKPHHELGISDGKASQIQRMASTRSAISSKPSTHILLADKGKIQRMASERSTATIKSSFQSGGGTSKRKEDTLLEIHDDFREAGYKPEFINKSAAARRDGSPSLPRRVPHRDCRLSWLSRSVDSASGVLTTLKTPKGLAIPPWKGGLR